MSVTKERDESYYAFNIDKKKGRLLNQKTLNFDNLNKGFYDDIMNYDGIIRKEKNELGETKQKGIKESVYSYKKIPEVWTNKLTYTSELYKTMKDDQNFLTYLGGLGDGSIKKYYSPPITSTTTNYNTIRSTTLPKPIINLNEKENINDKITNDIKENEEKEKKKEKESNNNLINMENTESKIITSKGNTNNPKFISTDAGTNRDIMLLLEEYKSNFPITLPSIPIKIPTVEEAKRIGQRKLQEIEVKEEKDEKKESKLSFHSPNISRNDTKDFHIQPTFNSLSSNLKKKKGELTKEEVFKTTIFNNLLPPEGSKNYVSKRVKNNIEVDLKKYVSFNSEELYKPIEITNIEVKKRLQDINYWGPYYPYCLVGRSKNLRFYQTMEPNQCIKLLNYIKKIRIKNRIKY